MKKQHREILKLRQKISELKDLLRPFQAISYKTAEVPKIYDVYSDDPDELVRVYLAYSKQLVLALNTADEIVANEKLLKELKNLEKFGGGI